MTTKRVTRGLAAIAAIAVVGAGIGLRGSEEASTSGTEHEATAGSPRSGAAQIEAVSPAALGRPHVPGEQELSPAPAARDEADTDGRNLPASGDEPTDAGSKDRRGLDQEDASETYALYRVTEVPAPVPLLPGRAVLGEEIPGADAEIVRHDDRIGFTLKTTELDRHAYTVWLIVFNLPELCRDPDTSSGRDFRCGPGDVPNPAAGFSIVYGTGQHVQVEPDAFHTFAGERERLDLDGVVVGPGLIRPREAEIHLVVRNHGPCPIDGCGDRTTTLDGGCSNPHFGGLLAPRFGSEGDYECSNPQATGH